MSRRGLSLIEVVAATALIAMAAAAYVPILISANRVLHEEPRIGADELGLLADAILSQPESFGLTRDQLVRKQTLRAHAADWRGDEPILITGLPSAKADADHVWLAFSYRGGDERPVVVFRWLPLPEKEKRQ